jgi:serine/threonine protein kinase
MTVAHYNLLERIGEGDLGEVYRARDTRVGRTVALTLAPSQMLEDAVRRERFLQDARTAAALSHPNIATLFDVGVHAGRVYLAYEFVGRFTLRQQMAGRPMNPRHALETAVQIADALAEAHAHGVLHTDLRPETIAITGKGSSKVLDFGMAPWTRGGSLRARAAESPSSLGPDAIGVISYMSPEQAIGGTADARTDVFSLGVIVYEMLTGRHPFVAATAAATLTNLTTRSAPPAAASSPELPRDLDSTLERALAKSLDARLQSAVAFAAELRSFLAVLDVRAGESARSELLPIDDDRVTGTGTWVGVAIAVLLVLFGVWYWFR